MYVARYTPTNCCQDGKRTNAPFKTNYAYKLKLSWHDVVRQLKASGAHATSGRVRARVTTEDHLDVTAHVRSDADAPGVGAVIASFEIAPDLGVWLHTARLLGEE